MASTPPASQDGEKAAAPPEGSPPRQAMIPTPPKNAPNRSSPSDSACVAETAALKLRVQCLEQDNAALNTRANDAESRATEADARAAAAEVETKKATASAQDRYAEKMHAFNETRHYKQELEKKAIERRSDQVRAKKAIDLLSSQIQQLQTEKTNASFNDGSAAQLRVCQEQLTRLRSDLQACHVENAKLKEAAQSSANTIEGLQGTVAQLQSDFSAEQAKTTAAVDAPTPEEIDARIDAARAEVMNSAKTHLAQIKVKLAEQCDQTVQKRLQQEQAQLQARFNQELEVERQKVMKPLEDEQQRTAALRNALQAAKTEIESASRMREAAESTLIHLQQQRQQTSQFNPSKRQRVGSTDTPAFTTPKGQRNRTGSAVSNGGATTPESLAGSSDVHMSGVQGGPAQGQQHYLTPRSMHSRQTSQPSSGPGAPSTPHQFQPQNGAGLGTPQQQNGMSPSAQTARWYLEKWNAITPEQRNKEMVRLYELELNSMTPGHQQKLEQNLEGMSHKMQQHTKLQFALKRMQILFGPTLQPNDQLTLSPMRLNAQNSMAMAPQPGQGNGQMSAQPSPFHSQSMSSSLMNNESPMRGMNGVNKQQTSPLRQQITKGQQLAGHSGHFSPAPSPAQFPRQINSLQQQRGQLQGRPQQAIQMQVQDQGQSIQDQMRQQMMRSQQISMNGTQRMPKQSSSSSMQPPAFPTFSPHMGQTAMSANQAPPPSYLPFDPQPLSSTPRDDQANGEMTGQEETRDVAPISDFDAHTYLTTSFKSDGSPAALPAGAQLVFSENADDDFPEADLQELSQMSEIPTVPSNGTSQLPNASFQDAQQVPSNDSPRMQNVSFQQPQQRFQSHSIESSQLHLGNPEGFHDRHQHEPEFFTRQMIQHGTQIHPSDHGPRYAPAGQFAPGSHPGTPASSRSTPAPGARARSQRLTPAPGAPVAPAKVPCVNCYRHWWEDSCSEDEQCSNCTAEGKDCVREKCFNYAAGACTKMPGKCPNVHEGDHHYQNEDHLKPQEKEGVRPKRLGTKVNMTTAPIHRA